MDKGLAAFLLLVGTISIFQMEAGKLTLLVRSLLFSTLTVIILSANSKFHVNNLLFQNRATQ